MVRSAGASLVELHEQAAAGVDGLIVALGVGRSLGMSVIADDEVRARLAAIRRFDAAALSADARCLLSANRVLSDQLHRLPEQQIRLDHTWRSSSSGEVIGAVVAHQRRAESDLHVLHTLSDATSAAAAGVDRLLRTFLLATARLADPGVADCPPAELGAAVFAGRVPHEVAVGEIGARLQMFLTSSQAVIDGIGQILEILNGAADGLGADPYPQERGIATSHPEPSAPDHRRIAATKDETPTPDVPLRLTIETEPGAIDSASGTDHPVGSRPRTTDSAGDLALAGDQ
ncbi:hypothetical protein QSJ18_16345 [Gordonia sp. ABSL1-1]|uniref:hypothetical protein n=1 Tax=Gordonia sp. ABSL1-1 TaxID=3053923 RepID=UPI0025741B54|nr:hypothetical protein [Gordonia sp. ABSL1-1]MDL9938323.1 hypothetical protein [Gordonia sp. ABSL1-1]